MTVQGSLEIDAEDDPHELPLQRILGGDDDAEINEADHGEADACEEERQLGAGEDPDGAAPVQQGGRRDEGTRSREEQHAAHREEGHVQ